MKFIYITTNVSMLEAMTELLDEMKFTDYQVIEQVTAKSQYGVPRLNTAIWPGYNSSILVQETDSEKVAALIDEINKRNAAAYNNGELIEAFVWNVERSAEVKGVE